MKKILSKMKTKKSLYLVGIPITLLIVIGISFLWASKYDRHDRHDRDDYYEYSDRDDYYERGDRRKYRRGDDRGGRKGYKRGDRRKWDGRGGRRGYGMGFGFNLRAIDADDDGDIKLEEVQNFSTKVFDSYDRNSDKKLTKDEFVNHNVDREKEMAKMAYYDLSDSQINKIKEGLESRFSNLDEDDDGYLSKDEFIDNRMNEYFKKFDLNDDGVIEKEEIRGRR